MFLAGAKDNFIGRLLSNSLYCSDAVLVRRPGASFSQERVERSSVPHRCCDGFEDTCRSTYLKLARARPA